MKSHTIAFACLSLIFAILFTRFHATQAKGFSIDLIHRDSLQSPSLISTPERVANALQRSFNCLNTLNKDGTQKSSSTVIVPDKGEYLMKFSLGTPPVETLAIADTGSDLIWIQCQPCPQSRCFRQKAPIFQPKGSSTYKKVTCDSNACETVQRSSCSASNKTCIYKMSYGDRSFSIGEVATETVTFGSTAAEKIPNVTIGCGHSNQGTFGVGASGIVGLGGGKVSLIRQMGASIEGKFSYCLVPLGLGPKTSKMNFGDQAVVSGEDVATTPIVLSTPETFYFLTLEGVTVGEKRLDFDQDPLTRSSTPNTSKAIRDGNIIIDSGTTLTFLPTTFYDQVIIELKIQIKAERVEDPAGLLKLCYDTSEDNEEIPEMIFHFKGADVKLKSYNTFVKTTERSLCLAFAPASTIAIYGNLAQMNYLVGYDLEKKTVSFKPTDCTQ